MHAYKHTGITVWGDKGPVCRPLDAQSVAVCCSLLQSVAACCSLLQSVAVWYRVFQLHVIHGASQGGEARTQGSCRVKATMQGSYRVHASIPGRYWVPFMESHSAAMQGHRVVTG